MNILAGLGHMDMLPIVYAFAITIGILIVYVKFKLGYTSSALIDITVFTAIFWLHGGSMTGALAATIAGPAVAVGIPIVTWMFAGFKKS